MENNKNKKSVKFQGDMLNFCDFIQVFVFTRNHHLNYFCVTEPQKFERKKMAMYIHTKDKNGSSSIYKYYFYSTIDGLTQAKIVLSVKQCLSTIRIAENRVGWSGGAMVSGNLPVPGSPTYWDFSIARVYCACSRCGWRLFWL